MRRIPAWLGLASSVCLIALLLQALVGTALSVDFAYHLGRVSSAITGLIVYVFGLVFALYASVTFVRVHAGKRSKRGSGYVIGTMVLLVCVGIVTTVIGPYLLGLAAVTAGAAALQLNLPSQDLRGWG